MRITILGNNSALPAFGRHPSAQTVTIYGEVLLIDCGEGTQIQMQRYGVKWGKLHHIFISHLHGDHYFGLPGLLNSMSLMGRKEPLHLYAPPELKPILDSIMDVAHSEFSYPLYFHPLTDETTKLLETPSFSVSCFQVTHRIKCYGFLFETRYKGRKLLPEKCMAYNIPTAFYESLKQGNDYTRENGEIIKNEQVTEDPPPPKKYAYCADTLFTDNYLPVITGVDALYHEATYLESDIAKAVARYHSTAAQAAQIAKLANAGQLLLGHFSSKYKELDQFSEEACAVFPNTLITVEGAVYDF